MNIELLDQADPMCEAFVRGHPDGRICHLWAWSEAVQAGFRHRVYYLAAREDGAVHGVLPLMHVRSLLFGNHLVSHALSDYGGILADGDAARDALFSRAVELAGQLRAESIEFRNVQPLPYELQVRTDKVSFRLALAANPEDVWGKFTSKSRIRNHVRTAEKAGITVADGGAELLDEFYGLYAPRMHQLGSPAYSKETLRLLLDRLPGNCRLFVARLGAQPVAVTLTFCFNGIVENSLGCTLVQYNNLNPNHMVFWGAMKHYCAAGAKWFEFGRSTRGGTGYNFKRQWLSEEVQLHYQYWVRPGTALSVPTPDSPKYKWKVDLWKRLPAAVANWLGPRISRGLP